jgi:hypothetical protein
VDQAAPGNTKIGAKIIVIISIISVIPAVNTAISVKTVFNPKYNTGCKHRN